MHQNFDIIITLAAALSFALLLGFITQKARLSPIVGYLIAGMIVGPYSPGFVADINLANQFAEIGIILLMFSVGMHFQLKDLLAVRKIALPGAVAQITVTTLISMGAVHFLGWSWSAGAVFGIAISVASTVVLTRVLSDNRNLHTPTGNLAIGWLVVEDLFTILVLVLLPVIFTNNSEAGIIATFGITILKLIALVIFMLFVGQKILPKILKYIVKTGSRDLFTLAVIVLALGISVGAAEFFGASMALGAFLAGMIVGQSDFSTRAASEALPMRDVFAVLFFVSVGMLFDPSYLVNGWKLILITLAIILIVKPLTAIAVVIAINKSLIKAVSVGVALAQIGEFSFILAGLGVTLNILPPAANNAIIAAAIISITLNPIIYKGIEPAVRFLKRFSRKKHYAEEVQFLNDDTSRVIVVGYGPVGRTITPVLSARGINVVVIEMNIDTVDEINNKKIPGIIAVHGDAVQREALLHCGIEDAQALVISASTAPSHEIIEIAKSLNPSVSIFIHTVFLKEAKALCNNGADVVFSGEGAVADALSKFLINELEEKDTPFEYSGSCIIKE